MKVLGITGGVGAGKSTVLSYLREAYGAAVIQCDETARSLQSPGGACYEQLVSLLHTWKRDGNADILFLPDGSFNRKELAARLFADPQLLQEVNRIVHPAVKEQVKQQIREAAAAGYPFTVVEAALLLEEHYDEGICDEIWYIHTDEQVRMQRLSEQRGYSNEKSRAIMAAQKPEAYFRRRCALTVDNSSTNVQNTFDQIDKGLIEHGFVHNSQRKQR